MDVAQFKAVNHQPHLHPVGRNSNGLNGTVGFVYHRAAVVVVVLVGKG